MQLFLCAWARVWFTYMCIWVAWSAICRIFLILSQLLQFTYNGIWKFHISIFFFSPAAAGSSFAICCFIRVAVCVFFLCPVETYRNICNYLRGTPGSLSSTTTMSSTWHTLQPDTHAFFFPIKNCFAKQKLLLHNSTPTTQKTSIRLVNTYTQKTNPKFIIPRMKCIQTEREREKNVQGNEF